ncbi:unnamed protein product [Caenorhabditis bovis]|nr:unnamed protein product [Caenorhabditis bovis]
MDDMVEQTLAGLKEELEEYRRANFNLKEDYNKLQEEMERKQYEYDNRLSETVNAARFEFNDEILTLKNDYERVLAAKNDLERKESRIMSQLELVLRESMVLKKELLTINDIVHDLNTYAGVEHEKLARDVSAAVATILKCQQLKHKEDLRKRESTKRAQYQEKSAQTEFKFKEDQIIESSTSNLPTESSAMAGFEPCWCSTLQDRRYVSSMADMIKMIDELSVQKDQLETTRRTVALELKEAKRQLSEVLIMHGEKIEELEELRNDNEDLRNMLKEQALSFTETQNAKKLEHPSFE